MKAFRVTSTQDRPVRLVRHTLYTLQCTKANDAFCIVTDLPGHHDHLAGGSARNGGGRAAPQHAGAVAWDVVLRLPLLPPAGRAGAGGGQLPGPGATQLSL